MSEKVIEILRLMEVRRSNLALQNDPIKFGHAAKRQEMLITADDDASVKDFKKSEEIHPQQHDLHQQGLKKEEGEKKKEEKDEKKKEDKDEKKKEDKDEKKEFKHAANNSINKLSANPKEIDPAITKAKESIETNNVFDASTTSFFKGYGIAAGHAEDEFGGLGLIGVFEEPKTNDGIRTANHSVYLFLFIILTSWFLFNNKIYK